MGWRTENAAKWDRETRTFAEQLRQESPGTPGGSQALDVFSVSNHVFFGGSHESRNKKAAALLAALAPVPSPQLRGIIAPRVPATQRTTPAQTVVRALQVLVDGSDALVQMHTAIDSMRIGLGKGSNDLLTEALQAWRLCLATAKCQSSIPSLRRVQIEFLESALAYCTQHGILLAELAGEVQDLLLSDAKHLGALSRVAAQQLPTLALILSKDTAVKDNTLLSRAVWEAVSRLMWDRLDWFADPAVHAVCCEVRASACNAWVAGGGSLTDPGAPTVLTAADLQSVKTPSFRDAGVLSVAPSPLTVDANPERITSHADETAAALAEVSQSGPAASPTEAAIHVQLSSHLLAPLKNGLADHMGVPEELTGLVRLKRIKPNNALLQHSMLFSGPAGCGKTYLARRLAVDLELPLYAFSGADLMSVYQGGPGLRVHNLFAQLRDEAKRHPRGIILFIDEAGRLLNDRMTSGTGRDDEGATESFLYELQDGDSHNANILVVCATNHPERIDPAAASRLLHFTLASLDATKRAELFLRDLKGYTHKVTPDDAAKFIATCHGLAGRDIAKLLARSELFAANRDEPNSPVIRADDLLKAWKTMEKGRELS